jgi:hypothetical protein
MWISRGLTPEGKIKDVTVRLGDFGEIDLRSRDYWFWCHIFPRADQQPQEPPSHCNLIFLGCTDNAAQSAEDARMALMVDEVWHPYRVATCNVLW